MNNMRIEEKNHRLPRELYRGMVDVSFTVCIKDRCPAFTDHSMVDIFVDILGDVANTAKCMVPVYCFMPDHQHLVLHGLCPESDLWRAIVQYKQKTGYWLSRHRPGTMWQKDFYDHIIRKDESLLKQVRYVLDNPVRKGLVRSWEEYPFTGAIGCELREVIEGVH